MSTNKNLIRILPAMSAIFVDMMSYALITPMIVAAFSQSVFLAGADPATRHLLLGLSFALFPLGMFFGATFLGDLSDRMGRKLTLMLCMTGLLLAFVLMALAVVWEHVMLLLIGRVLSGFMSGTTAISTVAIIDLSTEENKAGNIAKVTLANVSAHVIGPGVGGLLANIDMQWPFIMISLLALISLIWMATVLKETHTPQPQTQPADALRPLRIFADAFRHPRLRKLSLVQFQTQMGNCMCYQFFFLYMAEQLGYSPAGLGWFGALTLGIAALIMLCGGTEKLQKHFDERKLLIFNLPLAGVLAWIFILVPGEINKWLIAFFWAAAFIVCYVCLVKLYSDAVSEEHQGWAIGVFWSVFAFGFFLGGMSAALQHTIGTIWLLAFGGLLMVTGGITSVWLPRSASSSDQEPAH